MTAKMPKRSTLLGTGYLAITLTFGGLIGASLLHAAGVRKAIAAADSTIATRMATNQNLQNLDQKITLIQLKTNDYDRLVSPAPNLGAFLGQLNQAKEDLGLRDLTISTLTVISRSKSDELPIVIRGTGTFAQFHDFLQRLETLPRMSSVKHLAVEAADPALTGKVSIELTLSIYNTKSAP